MVSAAQGGALLLVLHARNPARQPDLMMMQALRKWFDGRPDFKMPRVLGVLTHQGMTAKWSPQMKAWSADPIPVETVRNSKPLELQGAAVFQNKHCRNCHALDGLGGERGPDLASVGTRLTKDQLIDQVSNGTPGGGNMPAYGKQVNAYEMKALAEFLAARRPKDSPPAREPTGAKPPRPAA